MPLRIPRRYEAALIVYGSLIDTAREILCRAAIMNVNNDLRNQASTLAGDCAGIEQKCEEHLENLSKS